MLRHLKDGHVDESEDEAHASRGGGSDSPEQQGA
jgi:hypothetical protein